MREVEYRLPYVFRGAYGETLLLQPRAKRQWFKSYLDKLVESWVYNQLAAQLELDPDCAVYQYRDRQKREIDFIVENGDGRLLGIEVKAGSDVGADDFKHLKWFRDNLAKDKPFVGIVVYTGDTTLPFGKNLSAVPMGALCS